jgi:hypothetical protein
MNEYFTWAKSNVISIEAFLFSALQIPIFKGNLTFGCLQKFRVKPGFYPIWGSCDVELSMDPILTASVFIVLA